MKHKGVCMCEEIKRTLIEMYHGPGWGKATISPASNLLVQLVLPEELIEFDKIFQTLRAREQYY